MSSIKQTIAMYSRNAYPSNEVTKYSSYYEDTSINSLIISGPNGYKGGIVYNDPTSPMFDSNGAYVGDSDWISVLFEFTSKNNISDVYFSLGDSAIEALAAMSSTALSSVMLWLKTNGLTGIDMDNEQEIATSEKVKTVTLAAIKAGLKLTAAPYYLEGWEEWYQYVSKYSGVVERFHLQCYDGGYGNDPSVWIEKFPSIPIVPGVESINSSGALGQYTPSETKMKYEDWQNKSQNRLAGGFIWQFFFFINTPGNGYKVKQYAQAISDGLKDQISN
ncbi:hypothetical protein [Hyunsoonleella pacifica]|uniref:GH18 domain-containing protein n=1 Tax=Hyunsoonleella pacifica TaxID=1080224 RepID=A0A4Q9FQ86_9FLAO|nr:hypothetical protein [Hyunsoonleella pacifica]TBN17474.1 hypothetical protein EYD46_03925 [Hyunsoonleella pacifica]GGD11692.1 hypothetical protein GCM10011368_12080 [Hyunsoonleella pacifica]